MKNIFKYFTLLLSIMVSFSACKQQVIEEKVPEGAPETLLTQEELDSLSFTYMAINDSLDATWTVMIQDDDEKIADMKRLLNEVAKTRRYDKAQHENLIKEVGQLSLVRYDRATMADSDKIDEYDSANSAVVKEVILFAANLPQYKDFPKLEDIINDIQAADNRVILHRIRYDRSAKEYNSFIRQNEKFFSQMEIYSEAPTEAALFELSN